MVENSFEVYISIFIFYIIPIDYATFIGQILIFGSYGFKRQLSQIIFTSNTFLLSNVLLT